MSSTFQPVQGPYVEGVSSEKPHDFTKKVSWVTPDGSIHTVRFRENDLSIFGRLTKKGEFEHDIGGKRVSFNEDDIRKLGSGDISQGVSMVANLVNIVSEKAKIQKEALGRTKTQKQGETAASDIEIIDLGTAPSVAEVGSAQQAVKEAEVKRLKTRVEGMFQEEGAEVGTTVGRQSIVKEKVVELAQYAMANLPKSLSPKELPKDKRRVSVTDEQGRKLELRLKRRGDNLYVEVRGISLGKGAFNKVEDVWALSVFGKEQPVRFAYAKSEILKHPQNYTDDEVSAAQDEHDRIIKFMQLIKEKNIPRAAKGVIISSTNEKTILSKVYPEGTCKSFIAPPVDKERFEGEDSRVRLSFLYDALCFLEFVHNMDPPIVHLDLKPENLFRDGIAPTDKELLEQSGALPAQAGAPHAVVSDWGTVTQDKGQVFDTTWSYAPPEGGMNVPATTAWDMHMIGVCMRHFTFGRREDHGDTRPYPKLDPNKATNPEHYKEDRLMLRLTAKDPKDRPTAAEARKELGEILTDLYAKEHPEVLGPSETSPSSSPALPSSKAVGKTQKQPHRKKEKSSEPTLGPPPLPPEIDIPPPLGPPPPLEEDIPPPPYPPPPL